MPAPEPLSALSVLVVDDSQADYDTYERYLSRDPERLFAIARAETAAEGLERYDALRPDCVLLDYQLPDDDGLTVLREIGERTPLRPLPVLMLTGQGSESVAAAAIRHGAVDYLVKGLLTPVRLRHAVQWAVDRARAERERLALQRALVHRVDSERRAAHGRWHDLADGVAEPVFVVADDLVHYANDAARRRLDVTRELVGRSLLNLIPHAERPKVEAVWDAGGGETVHALADGGTVRHVAHATDVSGQPGLQIVWHDA